MKILMKLRPIFFGLIIIRLWAERDSNPRRRKPADLQSAPVDRFGIDPIINIYLYYMNTPRCQTNSLKNSQNKADDGIGKEYDC